MKFINKGEPIKIRIGKFPYECYWRTVKTNEIVDLSTEQGKILGLTKLKTTEGQLGPEKVETKQIDNYTSDDLFFKELTKINGIGPKIAKDIVIWGTKEKLIETIKLGGDLPFRDDVEEKLNRRYGK